ncbi:long chain fatty alcohol oxidase [Xylaria bambusicola]|uniref:long chain fatty alcohol oxidase n=1 Tax=Xylaria bambusicola TaxID=326684 RepID=UPI002007EB1F|nr:long chain fatty alcohol oxidase [Xylaria bambusicola]KAI0526511.1 long chain fatty alcohol oxidase [Xylaria bambusicola]
MADASIPIPVVLPKPRQVDSFGQQQWQTLFALLDAITPSIAVESEVTDSKNQLRITEAQCLEVYEHTKRNLSNPPDYEKFKAYLRSRPVISSEYIQYTKRFVGHLPKSAQKELSRLLTVLNTQLGSLLATGYRFPLKDQPVHVREAIFQSWSRAWLSIFPQMASPFMILGKLAFTQFDPLFRELNDYTDFSDDYKPGPSFDYKFMQFSTGDEPVVLDVDVVIVGSGCGGGVCAKNLAEAGYDVLVVDKGYYFPPSQLPMAAEAANEFLFEGHAPVQTDDRCMSIISGSTWGGGGTINWSVSLLPQGYVRQEWADTGLDFFTTQEFQHCLDRVCNFMGVSDQHIRHNHGAQVILEGARKLGWHAKACPQNTNGAEHYCGNCYHGCGSGEKQGPAVSWLPAASRAGARFVEGLEVSRILFDKKRGSNRAVGIVGKWTSRDKDGGLQGPESERVQRSIKVKAKKVIVSCGSLQSPLLLMRSGLKNKQIGRNLYLHPTTSVRATFDKDVKGWEGGIITSVCTTFENLDGKGHGAKIETNVMLPYVLLYNHPYENGLQWKLDALRARQMNNFISIVRDRDTGYVYPDPDDGRPRIAYTTSAFDRGNLLTGVVGIVKLCYVQGATQIWTGIPGVPSFQRTKPLPTATTSYDEATFDQGINDPEFSAWVKLIEKTGLSSPLAQFACAHQMGSCRMSAKPQDGVVDAKGKVWGAQNLYVADASVFPSASGVNPMITNMGIADYISRGIANELKSGGLRASL